MTSTASDRQSGLLCTATAVAFAARVAPRLIAEGVLVKLLWDNRNVHVAFVSQPRITAPTAGPPSLLSNVVLDSVTLHAEGVLKLEQLTATGGAEGVRRELLLDEAPLPVNEQLVMVRDPENV